MLLGLGPRGSDNRSSLFGTGAGKSGGRDSNHTGSRKVITVTDEFHLP